MLPVGLFLHFQRRESYLRKVLRQPQAHYSAMPSNGFVFALLPFESVPTEILRAALRILLDVVEQ